MIKKSLVAIKDYFTAVYYAMVTNLGNKRSVDWINEKNMIWYKTHDKIPVIIVHGAMSNYHKTLYSTIMLLKSKGIRVISVGYDFHTSIEHASKIIQKRIDEIMEVTGKRKIDLIGICLGGLISRYYAEELGGKKHIHRLVTAYSPIRPIPKKEFGYHLNELMGGKPGLYNRGLKKIENKHTLEDYLYIYTTDDHIILPKYAIYKGTNQKALKGGHLMVSYRMPVIREIARFLKNKKME